jgi:hypothetical protein
VKPLTENIIEFVVCSEKQIPESDALYGIEKIKEEKNENNTWFTTFKGNSYFKQHQALIELIQFYKKKLCSVKIGFYDTDLDFWEAKLRGVNL